MIIGLLKEVKLNEYRVACTPDGVHTLVSLNHKVLVEKDSGLGAGFSNEEYTEAGASIVENYKEIYEQSQMLLQVRRPHINGYEYIKPGHILMGYFHFVANEEQTRALLDLQAICFAYETIETKQGQYPILGAMSELGGKVAILQAIKYMQNHYGGSGIFIGGSSGVEPSKVIIFGSGVAGINAAKVAAVLGADVYLLGLYAEQLQEISKELPLNVKTILATPMSIKKYLPVADVVVGAIYSGGFRAPKLVSLEDLKTMKPGSILVDLAIDHGGCFESSKPTTHQDPVYEVENILHYCVPNIPGAYSRTASIMLNNTSLPYIVEIANKGWVQACYENTTIAKGLQMAYGQVVHKSIGDTFHLSTNSLYNVLQKYENL